jgi:hypothetical protein
VESLLRTAQSKKSEHLVANRAAAVRVLAGAVSLAACWPDGPLDGVRMRRVADTALRAVQANSLGMAGHLLGALAVLAGRTAQEGEAEPRKATAKALDAFMSAIFPIASPPSPATTTAAFNLLHGFMDATEVREGCAWGGSWRLCARRSRRRCAVLLPLRLYRARPPSPARPARAYVEWGGQKGEGGCAGRRRS